MVCDVIMEEGKTTSRGATSITLNILSFPCVGVPQNSPNFDLDIWLCFYMLG